MLVQKGEQTHELDATLDRLCQVLPLPYDMKPIELRRMACALRERLGGGR